MDCILDVFLLPKINTSDAMNTDILRLEFSVIEQVYIQGGPENWQRLLT